MTHPLVDQFRFTRSEWLRGLEGVSEEDAARHFGPMNCISWNVGHLAWHEQRYWLERAQGRILFPNLNEMYAYGAPMSTPALRDMLDAWRQVTQAADQYLDSLTNGFGVKFTPQGGKALPFQYRPRTQADWPAPAFAEWLVSPRYGTSNDR